MLRKDLTDYGASGNKLSLPGFRAAHAGFKRPVGVLWALVDFGHA